MYNACFKQRKKGEAANYSLFSPRKPVGRVLVLWERLGSKVAVRMGLQQSGPSRQRACVSRWEKEVTFKSKLARVETKTDPDLRDRLNLFQIALKMRLFGGVKDMLTHIWPVFPSWTENFCCGGGFLVGKGFVHLFVLISKGKLTKTTTTKNHAKTYRANG